MAVSGDTEVEGEDAEQEITTEITNKESKFMIITNDIAWVYILKKESR